MIILTNFPQKRLVSLLFLFYLAVICWSLTHIPFIRNSGLNKKSIILLFVIKLYVGVLYGLLSYSSLTGGDNWNMHLEGIEQYHLLFKDPRGYVMNVFRDNYNNHYGGLLDTTDSYWNLLRSELMAKILSLFDIFSNCNYYINTLFYNFLVFFGFIALYRIFNSIYPGNQKLLIISIFLLPSLLYFSSGIHKDGLIFLAIAMTVYSMHVMLSEKKLSVLKLFAAGIGLGIIFLLRNYVMITLLPGLVAWVIASKRVNYVTQTFTIVYLAFTILFFSLYLLSPKADLPRYVSERQMAFIKISDSANSAININPLFPTFRSFFNNAPQAFNHSLMRPYLFEKRTFSFLITAGEIFIYEFLLLLMLLIPIRRKLNEPFVCFGIFFAISMMMIIGYTIPVIGAIVRYRSIYFPFLITPILCSIQWSKLSLKSSS